MVYVPEEADDAYTDLQQSDSFEQYGDECIDVDTDPRHCGECDRQCAAGDDDAAVYCEDGPCGIECDVDLT